MEVTFTGGSSRLGSLELRLSTAEMRVKSDHGSVEVEDPGVIGVGRGLRCWVNTATGVLLVAAQLSESLYVVDLPAQRVREVDVLLRDDFEDLRFLGMHPADDGSLLVLYERGLVCIDPGGNARWHRLHDDLSARLLMAADGVVLIETQWPLSEAGRRTSYRLSDGEELPSTGN